MGSRTDTGFVASTVRAACATGAGVILIFLTAKGRNEGDVMVSVDALAALFI